MANKLYQSKSWLWRQYVVNKKKPEEIAQMCGVTLMTIYRELNKNGMLKK